MEQWLHDHAQLLAILLALSEVLGMLPGVKSSSIFEIVYATLKAAKEAALSAMKPK